MNIAFRPLARSDFPDVERWRVAPHAAPWFEPLDPDAIERKYGPRVDGVEPTRVYVVEFDGEAGGFVQHYRIADYPAYAAACGRPDAVGIDICIGEERFAGRGLGAVVIDRFVTEVVAPAYAEIEWCVVTIETAHQRSRRAFEKAGFTHVGEAMGDHAPEAVYQRSLRG